MPSTVAQIAIFILMTCPGLTWLMVRERRRPRWTRSPFRETAEVIAVSAVTLPLGVTASFAAWTYFSSFDSRASLVEPVSYYREEPYLSLGAGASAVLAAVVLAACGGLAVNSRVRSRRTRSSVWHTVLNDTTTTRRTNELETSGKKPGWLVLCELDDGSQVTGILRCYDDEPGNEGRRDIVIAAPQMRFLDDPKIKGAADPANYHMIILNETNIKWWTTKHIDGATMSRYLKAAAARRVRLKVVAAKKLPDRPYRLRRP